MHRLGWQGWFHFGGRRRSGWRRVRWQGWQHWLQQALPCRQRWPMPAMPAPPLERLLGPGQAEPSTKHTSHPLSWGGVAGRANFLAELMGGRAAALRESDVQSGAAAPSGWMSAVTAGAGAGAEAEVSSYIKTAVQCAEGGQQAAGVDVRGIPQCGAA